MLWSSKSTTARLVCPILISSSVLGSEGGRSVHGARWSDDLLTLLNRDLDTGLQSQYSEFERTATFDKDDQRDFKGWRISYGPTGQ